MKISVACAIVAVTFTLSACGGSTFEWFPATPDSTAPTITAKIQGNSIFSNRTTHISAAANVVFSTNEAATIYYTTNATDPTITSSFVVAPANTEVTGPLISGATTVLKFFGLDTANNSSATQTSTIMIP